jgi:hypothetical protein
MSKSSQAPGSELSSGPHLSTAESGVTEVGVHIIFLPLDVALGEVDGTHVTTVGLLMAAKHIGVTRPRDIIVFAGQPWHFAQGALHPHPLVHTLFPETVLELHRSGPKGPEQAVWWSERHFTITTIADEAAYHQSTGAAADAVPYPFEVKPVTVPANGLDGKPIFMARSTVPLVTGRYKISFFMEGQLIDPNMHCL